MARTNACSSRTEASGCVIGQVVVVLQEPWAPIFFPSPHKRGHVKLGDGSCTGVATVAQLARMARVWDAGAALSEPKVGAQVGHVTRSMHFGPLLIPQR